MSEAFEKTAADREYLVDAFAYQAARGARNALEVLHEGPGPIEGGRVRWPGGSCLFDEAAHLSKAQLRVQTWACSERASRFIRHMSSMVLNNPSIRVVQEFHEMRDGRGIWDRPKDRPDLHEEIDAFDFQGRDDPIFLSTRRIKEFCNTTKIFARPLERLLQGNQGPAMAAFRGQEVLVETAKGQVSWNAMSHVGDRDMAQINIANHDAMFTLFRRACARYIDRDRSVGRLDPGHER